MSLLFSKIQHLLFHLIRICKFGPRHISIIDIVCSPMTSFILVLKLLSAIRKTLSTWLYMFSAFAHHSFHFGLFLRQGLMVQFRLELTSMYRPVWPLTPRDLSSHFLIAQIKVLCHHTQQLYDIWECCSSSQ